VLAARHYLGNRCFRIKACLITAQNIDDDSFTGKSTCNILSILNFPLVARESSRIKAESKMNKDWEKIKTQELFSYNLEKARVFSN
jgi:hypothetical protein